MNERKGKHLTIDERTEIQECLNKGMTFKAIAKRIGKDPTTVSKEVKKHIKVHTNSYTYKEECCPQLLKAPFVCNGCCKRYRNSCHFKRHLYVAQNAQSEYKETLVGSREGIPLNKESFYATEKIISNAVRNGQHIYHAIKANNLPVSVATVYRHINKGYYTIAPIDLPRAVKFKPRRVKRSEYVPSSVKKGRTFDDFTEYCEQNNISSYVEMDTVIGSVGGKVILTLHFTFSNFMIGILLDNKTASETADKINQLKKQLYDKGFNFSDIMPVILTDNGSEFSFVHNIEEGYLDDKKINLFFCHPFTPSEKPKIEKNHTLLREIAPQGTSFDSFTQETLNLIFSHVNSVKRNCFNGKSAYEMFCFTFSKELADAFGIKSIPADKVVQSPRLLK